VFGMFALEVARDYQPLKLSVLFLVLAWTPLLVVHEAGHALAAAVLGWRVCRVVIGMGKTVVRFAVHGVPVEVRAFPIGGYVLPAPRNLVRARLKNALVYCAGPGAELVVLAAIAGIVGVEPLFTRSHDPLLILAQSVAVAVALGVVWNLAPLKMEDGGWTDGLGMVMSGFLPREHFERRLTTPARLSIERSIERGELAAAVELAERALARHADDLPFVVLLAETLVEAGQPGRARELLAPWLERRVEPAVFRAELLCAVAAAERELGDSELASAEEHCRAALELVPGHLESALALGSVLVERGRFHEARRLIEAVRGKANDESWLDECDAWLVLADQRRGNREDARVLLDKLLERGARGRFLDAVSAEVRGPKAAPAEPAGPDP
jgi:hypothetical protein